MGGANGEGVVVKKAKKSGISKVLETGPVSLKKKFKDDVVLMLQSARLEEAWR
jgi:hypothetical protein